MSTKKKKYLFALCGLFSGLVNGLFGAGGGLLAVPALERIGGLETQKSHATALLAMLPLSITMSAPLSGQSPKTFTFLPP